MGLKDKLIGIRNKVKEGIVDTEHTIAKIDAFSKGMREAGQKVANTFRTFADREEVNYSGQEKRFSKTELMKKPWKWQKKVYESIILRLDASIDKVEDLARDVEIERAKDKVVETDRADSGIQEVTPAFVVAEPTEEYQYGADAFEAACPKMEQAKSMVAKTPETKATAIPKTEKVR